MAGFRDTARDVNQAIKDDNVVVNAAGLAFFGLLALVPTLLAVVSIYGLVRDPAEVQQQIGDLLENSPAEIRDFISTQLQALAGSSSSSLGITVVISILIALWSASGAIKHLMATLNDMAGYDETRGFLALRGMSYFLTLGAVVVLVATIFVLGVLPGLLAATGLGTAGRISVGILRFPLLLLVMAVSLSVLYHLGPDHQGGRRFRLMTVGAAGATIAWLIGSGIFSVYTANIGRLNETYAATGGLVILLLFMFLTALCVLLGAEIDDVRARRSGALAPRPATAVAAPSGATAAATATDRTAAPVALGGALVGIAVGIAMGRRR